MVSVEKSENFSPLANSRVSSLVFLGGEGLGGMAVWERVWTFL